MSLQEIERSHIQKSSDAGLSRTIDKSSEKMMLDILQVTQYAKPIDSSVRELASNAVDSQFEKEIAIQILKGLAKPEDYFITREGEQYEASKWDPEYYSLDHLDLTNNHIQLEYIEGTGVGFTDKFIVKDHGVGLGMPRLAGYFSLGYSTKRNSANQLGAFGLGAKAGLATGADHYKMETVHNGKRFRFNCFAYKIDSLVPKFDLEKNVKNKSVNIELDPLKPPYYAYYEETDEKNHTIVTIPVKRHNRSRFVQAVKNQLLYFKGVQFHYTDESDYRREISFLAEVLHNTDNLLVSDTYQFSRPHIVIVKEPGSTFGVTYGTIDFEALEMETLNGEIGFKCPTRAVLRDPHTGEETVVQEGVTVTPSRESVVWDNHTRDYIQKIIRKAQDEVSELIGKQLQEADFAKWIKKANDIVSSATSRYSHQRSALSVLSRIVDKSKISAKYGPDPSIRFYQNPSRFFWGIQTRSIRVKSGAWDRELRRARKKVERDEVVHWSSVNLNMVYFLEDEERHSAVKDRFLYDMHSGSFTAMRVIPRDQLIKSATESNKEWDKARIEKYVDDRIAIRDKIIKYLEDSTTFEFKKYSEVEVPESFEKAVEEEETKEKIATLSPAEKRDLQGKIVCYTYKRKDASYGMTEYRLDKKEPILGELDDVEVQVVYGTQADDDKLKMLAELHHQHQSALQGTADYFTLDDLKNPDWTGLPLVRFSKRNLKHIKKNPNFIHVDKYLFNNSKTHFSVGNFFISYFTGKYIQSKLRSLRFLNNFSDLHQDLAVSYAVLQDYVKKNYTEYLRSTIENLSAYKEFVASAEKGIEFQLFLRENSTNLNKEQISEKAKELFDNPDLQTAEVLDEGILTLIEELERYSEPVKDLFNQIEFFTNDTRTIPDSALRIIKEILEMENLAEYTLTENSIKILENLTQ